MLISMTKILLLANFQKRLSPSWKPIEDEEKNEKTCELTRYEVSVADLIEDDALKILEQIIIALVMLH